MNFRGYIVLYVHLSMCMYKQAVTKIVYSIPKQEDPSCTDIILVKTSFIDNRSSLGLKEKSRKKTLYRNDKA